MTGNSHIIYAYLTREGIYVNDPRGPEPCQEVW